MKAGAPHEENVQFIAAGSQVRRMRMVVDRDGVVHRVVTVDLPGRRGTAELWVDPRVAPVLAAQLIDGPVYAKCDMRDYRQFADSELTGLQKGGIDCARCGRDVEGSAVAVRDIGWTDIDSAQVVACNPKCGASPWDVEQLRCLLSMPDVEPEDEEPTQRFTCDSCGFDAPVVYVDGDRTECGKCRSEVSDHRREEFPGEGNAHRMLRKLRESTGFADDPAGGA